MMAKIQKQFDTPAEADQHYFGRGGDVSRKSHQCQRRWSRLLRLRTSGDGQVTSEGDAQHAVALRSRLPQLEQMAIIADLLHKLAVAYYQVNIPHDFLQLALSAAQHLQRCGCSNVVYELARVVGRMRSDGLDSRLPAKRMPMGLVEHMVHFFNANTYQKVNRHIPNQIVSVLLLATYAVDWTVPRGL